MFGKDYLLTALYEQHQMTNLSVAKGWSVSKNQINPINSQKPTM